MNSQSYKIRTKRVVSHSVNCCLATDASFNDTSAVMDSNNVSMVPPRHHNKVQVWCRLKPSAKFATGSLNILPDNKTINIHVDRDAKKGVVNHKISDWTFALDGVFNNASQETLYETVAKDIVSGALNGYNGTIMCYGQTGSGKTFTMSGVSENFQNRGLIPRAITQLFKDIEGRQEDAITVRISYLEIYNEKIFDLLEKFPEPTDISSPDKLVIVENNNEMYVRGLTYHLTQNEEEALNLLFEGETNRVIGEHCYNQRSTRSHCIFSIYIETRSLVDTNAKYTVSKLNFVDLAGSERLSKTKPEGKIQLEAQYINKSQSFLRQVVAAMAEEKRKHIPFRQSKLTYFLKDSIGGNCNTMLVANIWSEAEQIDETISTLRFATNMMCVPVSVSANEQYDTQLELKNLRQEVSLLKIELAMHDTLTHRTQVSYEPLSEQQRFCMRQQLQKYLDGGLEELELINIRQIQGYFVLFRELYSNLVKTVEGNFKQRYTLIDRTDAAAIAAAQKAGIAIKSDGTLVGELDGSGFGVGSAAKSAKADPSAVVQIKKGIKEKDKKYKSKERQSPGFGKVPTPTSLGGEKETKSPSTSPTEILEKKLEGKEAEINISPPESALEKLTEKFDRPSTPPSRTVAFEDYKQQGGQEINRILTENKGILFNKKKMYAERAREINKIKTEIDRCKKYLDECSKKRQRLGVLYDEEGEEVLSEEEFQSLKRLKQLKVDYRAKFEDHKTLKNEVFYCQKLVDQCRQKLIQDFDNWFADCFLLPGTEQTSKEAGYGVQLGLNPRYKLLTSLEDEREKYERIKNELLRHEPDLAPYHNALMRTQQRRIYRNAMARSHSDRTH